MVEPYLSAQSSHVLVLGHNIYFSLTKSLFTQGHNISQMHVDSQLILFMLNENLLSQDKGKVLSYI